ncbi:hypothetical protein [Shumkonia mesophila]|uniref:hypothetical protein n=1 Tax=Shumkonia mesophila TaxID=2838854 RepID=UPI00293474EA|nr:hypothetical protein [Shumkonia mesophila]
MDIKDRRALLHAIPRPGSQALDYVVSLGGGVSHAVHPAPLSILLRYVPDKWIVPPPSFLAYLKALDDVPLASVEAIGVAILEDVSDEVVPRWLQVLVSAESDDPQYTVLLEDRQPKWDNPALLSRLKRF